MRVSTTKVVKSLNWKPNYRVNILDYDTNNIYPQILQEIVNSSSTAKQCTKVLKNFIYGKGFEDLNLATTLCNDKETFNDVLRKCSFDYAIFNGFALHCNYNGKGEIISLYNVPIDYVRYCMNEAKTDIIDRFAIYDNWDLRKAKIFNTNLVEYINKFNPESAKDEFKKDKNFKGQLFYFANDTEDYPLGVGDSVIEDMITDAKIKIFKFRNITTNFMASHILLRPKFQEEEDRTEYTNAIQQFQGADNAGKIMSIETDGDMENFKLTPLTQINTDRLFEYTEKSIKENIREGFGVPQILMTGATAGKLGASNEFEDAYNYFNSYTFDFRADLEKAFSKILSSSIFKFNNTKIMTKGAINDNN